VTQGSVQAPVSTHREVLAACLGLQPSKELSSEELTG